MWDLFSELVRFFKDFTDFWVVFIAVVAAFAFYLNSRREGKKTTGREELDELGKLVWIDEGLDTKPFFNQEYRILAMPDAIYSKNGNVTVVEYKSRNGPVLESDVIQGLTACLAVKSAGYKVRDLMVITGQETKTVSVPEAAKSLYQMVANYVEGAREIKMESKNGRGSKSR